jgi:hypothetical protein
MRNVLRTRRASNSSHGCSAVALRLQPARSRGATSSTISSSSASRAGVGSCQCQMRCSSTHSTTSKVLRVCVGGSVHVSCGGTGGTGLARSCLI